MLEPLTLEVLAVSEAFGTWSGHDAATLPGTDVLKIVAAHEREAFRRNVTTFGAELKLPTRRDSTFQRPARPPHTTRRSAVCASSCRAVGAPS